MSLSRRSFLKATALAGAAPFALSAVEKLPAAHALGAPVGTVIDYSAGVPNAGEVKARGHLGAVRYVSERRPGAEWMKGKPVRIDETKAFAAAGLEVASVYQFGKGTTADWLQGAAGAAVHAPQAISLHAAAGGPTGRPIYVAIDDNPSRAQYDNQIKPYLQAFKTALEGAGLKLGVYGNYNVIEWASRDGLGEFFWMHDWGSNGQIHPRTTIHQKAGLRETISGIEVDVNNVYAHDWGQWKPGYGPTPAPETIPSIPNVDQLSSLLPADLRGIRLPSQQEINTAMELVRRAQALSS
ncbi:DUF1906 domain-containing protein [Corynebacterium sp. H130]|uniref:DUF1906 domain-containing protein n=1 Tax=Corynebacterium sp. H130 TaxID=3133444 RepID=UPI0030B68F3C